MYSSERFLQFAKEYIPEVNVKEESIKQVEDITELAREEEITESETNIEISNSGIKINEKKIEKLVADWLQNKYIDDQITHSSGIDLIRSSKSSSLTEPQPLIGYEVKYFSQGARPSQNAMSNYLNRLETYCHRQKLEKAYLVVVMINQSSKSLNLICENFVRYVKRLHITTGIGLILGTILHTDLSLDPYFTELAIIEPDCDS